MRSDLTPAFIAAKNSSSRKPRQFLVLQFPAAGNVYLSDQSIALGGVTYRALVESWGELTEAAGPDSDFTAEVRQMSVTLLNGGSTPISDLFLQEDPENVEALLYQWFDGLADSDKTLVDRFVVQDPINFDEASRLLTLDLVSVNMRYVGRCGVTVTTDFWPKAMQEHVGKYIPLIFGEAGECATLCVKTAPKATLRGAVVRGSMTLECNESLAAFPAAGILQVEDEKIQYSSRSDKVFAVQVRGYGGTERASHPDNAEVHQLITDHTYIVGEMPGGSITDVNVDGYPAPAGIYSTSLTGTYGQIVFNQKPYSWQFAASAQAYEPSGWLVAAENTAWQAHFAIDANKTSSSALINQSYPKLALKIGSDPLPDLGLIVTAYLEVHHWESNLYQHDYCEVWVEGIGVVGHLARPSIDDVVDLWAEVDIDHPHVNTDPGLGTKDPQHPHSTGATAGKSANGDPASFSHGIGSNGAYGTTKESYIWFYGLSAEALSSTISINVSTVRSGTARIDFIELVTEWGGTILLDNFDPITGAAGNITFSGGGWPKVASDQHYWVKVRTALYVNNGSINVHYRTPVITYAALVKTVASNDTGVAAYVATAGKVKDLTIDNRLIDFTKKNSPARTLVEKFDLSDHIAPTWSWFQGRRIEIRYVDANSGDSVNVFIPWLTFVVEYRARQKVFSDKVTAAVSSSGGNRPDQVLQALLGKAGLPAGYIGAASFADAGAEFAGRAYKIDGVIDGDLTVQDAIRKVCRQTRSRLFWSAGQAKLVLRRTAAEQVIGKYLGPENYQLQSIRAERQPVRDLVNHIELTYQVDRLSGEYLAAVKKKDVDSIAVHGKRDKPELFQFDLVRSATMAADLAGYYLATLAYPSTFYQFNGYLDQFEVEKDDVLALTSAGFHKIRKMPLRVKSVGRQFGSGKNKTINHLRIIAECLRYILLEHTLADQVLVFDHLTATIGKLVDLAEQIHVQDDLSTTENWGLAEQVTVADALEMVWTIATELTETVTVGDDLSMKMRVGLQDTVMLLDQLTAWRSIGFGSQDFGRHGFGGIKEWEGSNPDEVLITDELGMAMRSGLSESVTVADQLVCSNGFGSRGGLGDGVGNIPFGN